MVKCIEDEIPFEIPESWAWVRIRNLGTIIRGNGIKRSEIIEDGFPCVRYGEIYTTYNSSFSTTVSFIAEELHSKSKHFSYGDILMTLTGENKPDIAKAVAYLGKEKVAASGDLGIWSHHGMTPLYLVYLLDSPCVIEQKIGKATGNIIVHISGEKIGEILVSIPPLNEQERIVQKVQDLESSLRAYQEKEHTLVNLQMAFPSTLEKSILQHAVQGKLVPQDESDEPASVLLERIRAEKEELIKQGKLKKDKHEFVIFRRDNSYYERLNGVERCIDDEIPFEIPNHWHWERMGNISFITKLAGFEYTKYISPAITAKGIPLLKGKNVQNSIFVENFESYIPESISDFLNRSQLAKKCILTPYVGSIGNVAIFHGNYKAHLGSNIGKIELYTTDLLEEYVVRYLHSNTGYEQLIKHKKATAQDSISMAALRDVLIPLPPTFEQERIIDKINNILSLVKKQ